MIFLFRFFYPAAVIFGLIVMAALLTIFVFGTREKTAVTVLLHDRPILILLLLLVVAYMIIRIFGSVVVFLIGFALPLACKSNFISLFL